MTDFLDIDALKMDIPRCEQRRVAANGFIFNVNFKKQEENEGFIICHHGIGSSAYTFTHFLQQLHAINPNLGFLAYDTRHHGYTYAEDGKPPPSRINDLDLNTLQGDLEAIVKETLPNDESLNILLLGHSMGGTLMAKYANDEHKPANLAIRGLIVLDAVEGYAKKSLMSMHALLNLWPTSFRTKQDAISWHIHKGNLLRNVSSAEVSVPPLFIEDPNTKLLHWKLDLSCTEGNWDNWFANLDEYFVSAPAARLLILAGVGRLDTALTRAQMQGKFQLVVVNEAGHFIQEDAPAKCAEAVANFWERNGKPIKIIPKFGQIRTN